MIDHLEPVTSHEVRLVEETIKANCQSPQEVKAQYGNASICSNNRVVFNFGGNKYRLVVEIPYQAGIVWVKFIGTHNQYNKLNNHQLKAGGLMLWTESPVRIG